MTALFAFIVNFCETRLIATDPYQFEQAPIEWVTREAERLAIKRTWGKLGRDDAEILQILEREIENRKTRGDTW